MEKKSRADLRMEAPDGGLKELVLRWFTETQAPLILHSGNFPDWFQGFAARKETEDLLRDKAPGCFLIRLSDKAIGYILSYKGHDRCRHFVIVQNGDGQFVISGDRHAFGSIAELIEHYKASPIPPFGERLTSSCHEVGSAELYDVVTYDSTASSGLSVLALKTLWDQKHGRQCNPGCNDTTQQQHEPPMLQPPALPPKGQSRKLTGVVSVDPVTFSQTAPPVPKRGAPLSLSLSGPFSYATSHQSEALTDPNRSGRVRAKTATTDGDSLHLGIGHACDPSPPAVTYSELAPVQSKPLPGPNTEEEAPNQISSPPFFSYSPSPLKTVTCHTYSLHEPRGSWSGSGSEQHADDVGTSRSNPLYQVSGWAQKERYTYAEVHQRSAPSGLADDAYEQVPREPVQGNMYESVEDMKSKKSKSTWGKNNMKWKKFLPDYKRK